MHGVERWHACIRDRRHRACYRRIGRGGLPCEIAEESGYWHILFRRTLKFRVHDKFFHTEKHVNRFAHFTVVYCMVTDQNAVAEVERSERERHVPRWVLRKDVEAFLSVESHKYVWNRFLNK